MSSSRLISCRCFFRRIERALLSPKHILSFALTPRLLCHQILTLGKLWARLCERIRWWANDFVCSFQKLALRCPFCRCRYGHGRGDRAVALDQFFQFSHIAAEVSDITPKVIKTFPDFREVVSQALFTSDLLLYERSRHPCPSMFTLSTGYQRPQPRISARSWPFRLLIATIFPMGQDTRALPMNA